MNKSLKVFLACVFGAGIGTLVALQVNGYFWWLGLIVGGFVGYLSYEFKAVVQTIPKAWRAVISWQPKFNWRYFGKALLGLGSLHSHVGVFMTMLLVLTGAIESGYYLMVLGIIFLLCGGFALFWSTLFTFMQVGEPDASWMEMFDGVIRFNPVSFYFYYLPVWFVKGIFYVVPRAPGFLRKVVVTFGKIVVIFARFVKTLFIMIHSEIRLLCALDAAIGAGIGYFAGSVLIGALAGGLVGVLNYEVITKRILHLNTSKAKTS